MRAHLPALDHGLMDPAPVLYTIRINGHLGATILFAFPAMTPQRDGANTVLTGLLDRSALYGVLAEIDALGLDLLEVRQLTPDRESPAPGDSRSGRDLGLVRDDPHLNEVQRPAGVRVPGRLVVLLRVPDAGAGGHALRHVGVDDAGVAL